ncbi:hypothetical protein OC844_005714 [Tilletia horrida]|nr:hypothetical protein OC844_005714 [Tilletia horrida]
MTPQGRLPHPHRDHRPWTPYDRPSLSTSNSASAPNLGNGPSSPTLALSFLIPSSSAIAVYLNAINKSKIAIAAHNAPAASTPTSSLISWLKLKPASVNTLVSYRARLSGPQIPASRPQDRPSA